MQVNDKGQWPFVYGPVLQEDGGAWGGARTQILRVFLLSTAVLNVCRPSVIQERSPASFNSALKEL